jgi:hypothetical protein
VKKKNKTTYLSENVYDGKHSLPHSHGTSFVLGASNIPKSQELGERDLHVYMKEEAAQQHSQRDEAQSI